MVQLYKESDYFREQAEDLEENHKVSYRSNFRRDFARLIHSPAFRRLQGKTQLFPGHESDFFRNRLTHSLEVAQIAKTIAIKINTEHEYFKENICNKPMLIIAIKTYPSIAFKASTIFSLA